MTHFRRIDDVCDVVAIHFVNGIWGHLAVGFFGDPSTGPKSLFINGSLVRLKIQFISALCMIVFSAVAFYLIMKLVDLVIGVRLSEEAEMIGADKYEHDIDNNPIITLTKVENLQTPENDFAEHFRWKNQYNVNQGFQN